MQNDANIPTGPRWRAELPDGRATEVRGHTAGEARAAAKVTLGIPRAGRLPVGTRLSRIDPDEKDAPDEATQT